MGSGITRRVAGVAVGAVIIGLAAGGAALATSRPSDGGGTTTSMPTKGPVPDAAFNEDGSIDPDLAPDFIEVERPGDEPGYVRRTDIPLADRGVISTMPVYGPDLVTEVGRMVTGVGFVGSGEPVPEPSPSEVRILKQ